MNALVSLDQMMVPAHLDGSRGRNRASSRSQLAAADDRSAVLAWLAAGNKPLPVDPIPSLPITGTKYKFRLALNKLGLRAAVETAVAASTNQDIKDAWVYADEFRSDDPLVLQLGLALGKTEAEIRAVFELANSL